MKLITKILYFVLAFITCVLLFEVLLHIYNPNKSRVKNGKIALTSNSKRLIENNDISKLSKYIIQTKNSIGFRGPEIPINFDAYLSIITIGGSTTECAYLSDNETWPFLVEKNLKHKFANIWLNNAGLDGFSTFGQSLLLRDYIIKLKPKIAVFMPGANDVGRDDLNKYDMAKIDNSSKSKPGIKKYLKDTSEIIDFIVKLRSAYEDKNKNIGHKELDITKMDHTQINLENINYQVSYHQSRYIPGYIQRLNNLVEMCKKAKILPVFITQPILFGKGIDPQTNINMETIVTGKDRNGKCDYMLMELYNKATRDVASSNNIPLIDLSAKLPTNSDYFYDEHHFSVNGAKVAAKIISDDLIEIINSKITAAN